MPVIDLQRAIAEIGRIRIGQLVPGTKRPTKLDTFRLTSADKRPIEAAARLFGGTVEPWEAPAGPQWQVVTETAELAVIVPPADMAFSQYLELWSGGGCLRRCDGATELLTEQPCLCAPEKRECDYHTRLSVMIRDLPGLGVWRLDTQGWYAARELAGAVEIIRLAAGHGILLPARLLVEQRSVKRIGANGKPQTLRFPVPRLDPGITPGELLAGQTGGMSLAIAAETRPLLTPVPQIEGPQPTIAEQSAPPPERPARRNAAPAIASSGRRRSTPDQAPPDAKVIPDRVDAGKKPGDDGYWRARAFADGAERGIDGDRMRELAALRLAAPIEGFSMSTLDETDWEEVHRVIVGFPPTRQAAVEDPDEVADSFLDDDPLPFGAGEQPSVPDLAERIRSKATASNLVGPMAAPQATNLGRVLKHLGPRAVKAGIEALWPGIDWTQPSAAQAQAILLAADSDPEFDAHWMALATQEAATSAA